MVKVIGYRDVGFTAQSGEFVEGRTYYLCKDIDAMHGIGVSAEKYRSIWNSFQTIYV